MERPTCRTCPYWDIFERDFEREGPHGYCRRHAPLCIPSGLTHDSDNQTFFPTTFEDDWCGEHPGFVASLAGPGDMGPSPPLLGHPIEDLALGGRITPRLVRNGITTVGQLVRLRGHDIVALRNLGYSSVRRIREALAAHGLSLADEFNEKTGPPITGG